MNVSKNPNGCFNLQEHLLICENLSALINDPLDCFIIHFNWFPPLGILDLVECLEKLAGDVQLLCVCVWSNEVLFTLELVFHGGHLFVRQTELTLKVAW